MPTSIPCSANMSKSPSRKAVGTWRYFFGEQPQGPDVLDPDRELRSRGGSGIGCDLIAGRMGQPPGGVPPRVARHSAPTRSGPRGDPGTSACRRFSIPRTGMPKGLERNTSAAKSFVPAYPRVFVRIRDMDKLSDTRVFRADVLYGLESGEETAIDIEPAKPDHQFYDGDPHPKGIVRLLRV